MKYLSAFASFIFVFAGVFFVVSWLLVPPAQVFELESWKDHCIGCFLGAVIGGLSAYSALRKERKEERDKKDRQETSDKPHEGSHSSTWLMIASIGTALAMVAFDAVLSGTYTLSAIVCPPWFLISLINSAIQRPGWRAAIIRIAIPAVTLGVVLTNNTFQFRIAQTNATRIVDACEKFHTANAKFPQQLDDLVPNYLESIPRAKYCLVFGQFLYWNHDEHPLLMWYDIPPFGRKTYDFEKRRWRYID